ncbi:hypothetical protein NI17_011345 [Thermobifida halotolerans]|uniref:Uncharacterized protein n=1 Tax=Thermobifida halotolerans TaxID=483545 RepID=A0A399G6E9_9ACTN|nr:hypothetical protein [Thermobifida halotolerans]UOE21634.1 hypothetical protein NI17_011345 [Thermobifida halotolerans]
MSALLLLAVFILSALLLVRSFEGVLSEVGAESRIAAKNRVDRGRLLRMAELIAADAEATAEEVREKERGGAAEREAAPVIPRPLSVDALLDQLGVEPEKTPAEEVAGERRLRTAVYAVDLFFFALGVAGVVVTAVGAVRLVFF